MSESKQAQVHWERLLPEEFLRRQRAAPVVYLPLGICEPHGHGAPFGLDTLKAEWLCTAAARRYGGIVAPTLGYQIHECGYHARWLEDVVGEVNPRMTALPPDVVLRFFLYRLRAFAGAGFSVIVAITGHAGGNEDDFRRVAAAFATASGVRVIVRADPELAAPDFPGDHAGQYELSQLLYLHPELMDLGRLDRAADDPLGRFAQNPDAAAASADYGQRIMARCLDAIGELLPPGPPPPPPPQLTYRRTEAIWQSLQNAGQPWRTAAPAPGQPPVSPGSRWKPYEHLP